MMFELLLDVLDRFLNLRDSVFVFEISSLQSSYRCAHLHESYRTLRDGFWGGAVPGTSCQATIAPSLRDISQQALASVLSPAKYLVFRGQDTRAARTTASCKSVIAVRSIFSCGGGRLVQND